MSSTFYDAESIRIAINGIEAEGIGSGPVFVDEPARRIVRLGSLYLPDHLFRGWAGLHGVQRLAMAVDGGGL